MEQKKQKQKRHVSGIINLGKNPNGTIREIFTGIEHWFVKVWFGFMAYQPL